MKAKDHHGLPEVDEGSWIYLSASATSESSITLREQLIEACAQSGWPTVSCRVDERVGRAADPGHFFAGMSHAVRHADAVVALIGAGEEMSDAELTLAYSHGRPVVGVQITEKASPMSSALMQLREYERARVIVCESAEECAAELREAFADPDFAETIRQAR